jgi:hypothetical protein
MEKLPEKNSTWKVTAFLCVNELKKKKDMVETLIKGYCGYDASNGC